jgi:hypothetical protein
MNDKQRADTYRKFLSRLYVYRNITMDHSRIQQWIQKLDEWGAAADDQMVSDSEWESIMTTLALPEGLTPT